MTACSWFYQIYHRRKRYMDIELMWPTLLAKADTIEEARVAWDVFIAQDGQEHWHCACGQPIAQLFQVLIVTVEP